MKLSINGSSLGLMMCLFLGISVSLISNKMFLVWLGLEMNMFGMMPFLKSNVNHNSSMLLLKNEEVNVSFFYFLVQVMGSLLFAWGAMFSDWYIMSMMGLIMKVGMAPFFWWVPPVISRLDWFSMGILSTMQKIPSLFLFRMLFDVPLDMCFLLSIMGFSAASMGMKFSYGKLKQLLAWSSMSNMSVLIILFLLKLKLGIIFYVFYSVLVISFCLCLTLTSNNVVCNSFLNGDSKSNMLVSCLLLVFSGLPPFISFILKMFFFSGLLKKDCSNLLMDMEFKGNEMSFFYLLGSHLKSWNMLMIYMFLMILQAVGYMKAFMKINSTGSSRLFSMTSSLSVTKKAFMLTFFLLYMLSVVVMWMF